MRVALVVNSFPKLSETFIVRKFLGLLRRDVDVHIVCTRNNQAQWQLFPELDALPEARERVHTGPQVRPKWRPVLKGPRILGRAAVTRPKVLRSYLAAGATRLIVDAALIDLKPDIVHFEFGALAPGRMHVRQTLGCRVVVSFRGYDLNLSGLEDDSYYDDVWSVADAAHFLGRDLWAKARARGCPAELPHVFIPPAVDLGFWDRESDHLYGGGASNRSGLRILSVGRLDWRKGFQYGLQSVRLLMDRGTAVEWHIVGDGPALEEIAFARYELRLGAAVQLRGALPATGVREEMIHAGILLHPAVSEGFCNAVVEAQAMGLPCVVSDAGGLPENVADEISGFVVPRRDPGALADRLETLAMNPDLRQTMSRNARQRAEDLYSLDQQIDAFVDLYAGLSGEDTW